LHNNGGLRHVTTRMSTRAYRNRSGICRSPLTDGKSSLIQYRVSGGVCCTENN
jgi:hypothetical protein